MVHGNAIGLGRGSGKIDQRSDPVQFACLFMPHFAAGTLTGRGGDHREVVVYFFARGLEIGETVSRARVLSPRSLFLPRQRGLEEHRWEELLQQLLDCTPQVRSLHDDHLIGRWVLLQVDCGHDLYSRTPVEQLKFFGFDRDMLGFLLPLGFRTKTRVLVAVTAILKQRPPTAKGVMFITLEDETGYIQVVIFPQVQLPGR